jgi:hypothetical protein
MQIFERLRARKTVVDEKQVFEDAKAVYNIVRNGSWAFAMDMPKSYLLKYFNGNPQRLERACSLLSGKAGFVNCADHLHYEKGYAFNCAKCIFNKPSVHGFPVCIKKGTSLMWQDARFICAEACPVGLEAVLQ